MSFTSAQKLAAAFSAATTIMAICMAASGNCRTMSEADTARIRGGEDWGSWIDSRECVVADGCIASDDCDQWDNNKSACLNYLLGGYQRDIIAEAGTEDCAIVTKTFRCREKTPNNDCAKQYNCKYNDDTNKCNKDILKDTWRAPADCEDEEKQIE